MQAPALTGSTTARDALFVALGLIAIGFIWVIVNALRQRTAAGEKIASPLNIWVTSFIANFFDTLGVGSFATTTSVFRQWRMVPDERIPGTLNIGYALPTIVQAYIYTKIVPVDSTTLVLMIAAAVVGAWLGAGVVSAWPRRRVQIGMGLALLGFVVILLMQGLNAAPTGSTLLQLTGTRLVIGVCGNFALGALMTLGVGLYAPCMILVSLLGMNKVTAFPIMMGSCAFLMPLASVRFVRTGGYLPSAMIGMMVAGIPAVLIAAFIVKTLSVSALNWLVIVVVTYTAVSLLRAARRERQVASDATAAEAAPAV
jgi:uncharacterized membrane protein YfcA